MCSNLAYENTTHKKLKLENVWVTPGCTHSIFVDLFLCKNCVCSFIIVFLFIYLPQRKFWSVAAHTQDIKRTRSHACNVPTATPPSGHIWKLSSYGHEPQCFQIISTFLAYLFFWNELWEDIAHQKEHKSNSCTLAILFFTDFN